MPTWSLTYEWLFYLTFPAVLLLSRGRRGIASWQLALCALVVLVALAPIGSHYMRLLMFVLGAWMAAPTSADLIRKFAATIPDAGVLLVYVAANLLFVANQDWYRFIPVYLVTSAALVVKVVHGTGFLHRVFCLGPFCRLGNISYSFYLFHGLAIVVFCDHVGPYLKGVPEAVHFSALMVGSFGLSVLAGQLSYMLLEKPYFNRTGGRQRERRGEAPPATALGSGRGA